MKKSICSRKVYVFTMILVLVCIFITYHQSYAAQPYEKIDEETPWTIHFRPGIRLGTDNRVVYTLDFLVPLYQDERNILFFSPKYSPNNRDSWEVNLGLGYRHMLIDDHLVLGINGFYDQRKTPWGTNHNQWGVGIEIMGEVPLKNRGLGLTGRMNYYNPISSANIDMGPNGGYIYQGLGVYVVDVNNIWLDEPMRGVDYELGVRIPFVSDYVETWIYGGGYHYEGDYIQNIDGFSMRAEVIPTDFLKLSYEYRDDNFYGGEHYGEIGVDIPFSIDNLIAGENPFAGIGDMLHGSRDLEERLTEPVRRDVDIIAPLLTGIDAVNALDLLLTKTNTGYVDIGDIGEYEFTISKNAITYVSETGSDDTGDGSEDNPYGSIEKAFYNLRGLNALIYVLNDSETETVQGGYLPGEDIQAIIFGSVIDLNSIFNVGGVISETVKIDILSLQSKIDLEQEESFPTVSSSLYMAGSNHMVVAGLKFIFDESSPSHPISAISIVDYNEEESPANMIVGNIIDIRGAGDLYGIEYLQDINRMDKSYFNERPLIVGNKIKVYSSTGWVRGVYIDNEKGHGDDRAGEVFWVDVIDNYIDVECNKRALGDDNPSPGEIWPQYQYEGAFGIFAKCSTVDLLPLWIKAEGNYIKVTNHGGEAYGISCMVDGILMGDFIDNTITIISEAPFSSLPYNEGLFLPENQEMNAGIYLEAYDSMGEYRYIDPVNIEGNIINVSGGGFRSCGIAIDGIDCFEISSAQHGGDSIYFDIWNNTLADLSGELGFSGISSDNDAYGIYCLTYSGPGSEKIPLYIGNNPHIKVSSAKGDGYGICCISADEHGTMYADVSGNFSLNGITETPGIVVSGENAYGVYLNSRGEFGSGNSPVTVRWNSFLINGTSSAYCVLTPSPHLDESGNTCNKYSDISNNNMNVFSDWIAIAVSQGGYNLVTNIDNNFMNLSSTNADAAGVLLMGYSLAGDYRNVQTINFDTPLGSAFDLIDAVIVEDLAALSNQIASGTTDWLYVKDADYTGFVDSIDRSLNIWGEGYQMLGYGSANYPTINETLVVTAPNTNIFGVNIDVVGECGIDVENADNLTIRSSRISVYNPLGDAYGIYFNGDVFGTEDASVIIADNEIDIISDAGNAYGVYIEGDTGSNVDIIGNDITSSITGEGNAYGIYLKGTEIGSEGVPIVLADNEIEVSCNIGNANGICVEADNYAYLDIKNNIIDAASSGYFARGVYINCIDDVDVENHINVDITGNDISVNSSGDAVGIHIYKDGFVYDVYDEISETYGYTNGVLLGCIMDNIIEVNSEHEGCGINLGWFSSVGSPENLFLIDGNSLQVITGDRDNFVNNSATGIKILSADTVYAEISHNIVLDWERVCYGEGGPYIEYMPGIFSWYGSATFLGVRSHDEDYYPLNSLNTIGTDDHPFLVHDNTIRVSGYGGESSGIRLSTMNSACANIYNNTIDLLYSTKMTGFYFDSDFAFYSESTNFEWGGNKPIDEGTLTANFFNNTGSWCYIGGEMYLMEIMLCNRLYSSINMGVGPEGMGNNTLTINVYNWNGNYGLHNEIRDRYPYCDPSVGAIPGYFFRYE